jgi:hypothetical protein
MSQPTEEAGLVALIAGRGDVILYRPAQTNHCPRCGQAQWHVGRVTAECAFCGTALPLVSPTTPSIDPERTEA